MKKKMKMDLAKFPHVEMAMKTLEPIITHIGFSKSTLIIILNAFRSDNWFGGMLKKVTNNDPVIMDAFYCAMDELIEGISIAMNVNFVGPRRNARVFQIAQNEQYWGNEGEGTRAKKIVIQARAINPNITKNELAAILTRERVLTFRGRMTLPQNRTDVDTLWSYQQVYNLMKKYMGIKS